MTVRRVLRSTEGRHARSYRPRRAGRGRALVPALLVPLLAAGSVAGWQVGSYLGGGLEQQSLAPRAPVLAPPPTAPPDPSNGVERLRARDVLLQARQAADRAGSARLVGTVREGNQPVELDLRVQGRQGIGRIRSNGTSVLLVKAGRDVHVWADEAFYERFSGPEVSGHVADEWVRLPPGSPGLARVAGLFDIDGLLDRTLAPEGEVVKVGERVVDGVRALQLRTATGLTLSVALDGEPHLLRAEPGGKPAGGSLQFSDWGAPVEVRAPTDPQARTSRPVA